jgi:hypothetical protein
MKHSTDTINFAKVLIPVGCVAVSALAVAPAQAAFLSFAENPNNTLTIEAADFENGFFVNGNQLTTGLGGSNTGTYNSPVSFSGSWIDNGQTSPLSRNIYFTALGCY